MMPLVRWRLPRGVPGPRLGTNQAGRVSGIALPQTVYLYMMAGHLWQTLERWCEPLTPQQQDSILERGTRVLVDSWCVAMEQTGTRTSGCLSMGHDAIITPKQRNLRCAEQRPTGRTERVVLLCASGNSLGHEQTRGPLDLRSSMAHGRVSLDCLIASCYSSAKTWVMNLSAQRASIQLLECVHHSAMTFLPLTNHYSFSILPGCVHVFSPFPCYHWKLFAAHLIPFFTTSI